MIFFRVSQNINIKTTDGTMVNYFKFKEPSNLENETLYISTYDDFKDLREIFSRVDKDKYFAKVFNEEKIRALKNFPIELGITNIDEYNSRENSTISYQDIKKVDIYKQLKNIQKDEITVAIIGGVGLSISQTISSCTALRILHKKLKQIYKNIKFDIYLNSDILIIRNYIGTVNVGDVIRMESDVIDCNFVVNKIEYLDESVNSQISTIRYIYVLIDLNGSIINDLKKYVKTANKFIKFTNLNIFDNLDTLKYKFNLQNNCVSGFYAIPVLLENFGLIERKRRGLGKPSLVYVKNFSSDLSNERVQNRENHESGSPKNACQDPPKSRCNKNKKSKTERNNTNPILSDELEKMKNRKLLEEYFSRSLEIELLLRLYPDDEDTIYQIVDLLVDTCDSKRKLIRIAGDDKPAEVVLSRLKKLNADHIRFVLDCLAANTSPIRNMKQYLLAALFNAPTTIQLYYQNKVNHDLAARR